MRRALLAAIAAIIVVAAPAPASAGTCHTHACFVRACSSHACKARVARKQARRHKRAVIAPFRSWLLKVRTCESSGRYATNTGNGFYGAYQFTIGTWHAAGGRSRPDLNEPLEQDYRAVKWRLVIGNPHQSAGWPVCG